MKKTPTLEQIADSINSYHMPQEKLAVELSSFSGIPWKKVLDISFSNFQEYLLPMLWRTGREMLRVEPVEIILMEICSKSFFNPRRGERFYYTYLGKQGCKHFYEVLLHNDLYHSDRLFTHKRAIAKCAEEQLGKHGLEADSLRQYFQHSLIDAKNTGKTDLTSQHINFLLGRCGLSERLLTYSKGVLNGPRQLTEYLRREYAKLEPIYFSTSRSSVGRH